MHAAGRDQDTGPMSTYASRYFRITCSRPPKIHQRLGSAARAQRFGRAWRSVRVRLRQARALPRLATHSPAARSKLTWRYDVPAFAEAIASIRDGVQEGRRHSQCRPQGFRPPS